MEKNKERGQQSSLEIELRSESSVIKDIRHGAYFYALAASVAASGIATIGAAYYLAPKAVELFYK